MLSFIQVGNKEFLSKLFRNLSRQKQIPVSVDYNGSQYQAEMTFSHKTSDQPDLKFEQPELGFEVGEKIKVIFFFKEVLFIYETQIIGKERNSLQIKKPGAISTSFRRLMHRYKPVHGEEISLLLPENDMRYKVLDISTSGAAFECIDKRFEENQVKRSITINLNNVEEIHVDAIVKYCKIKNNGNYVCGISFTGMDWMTRQKLFSFIFQRTYPDLKALKDYSCDEILKLYYDSKYLRLKPDNDENNSFAEMLRYVDLFKDKPMIFSNLLYFKNGKLLSIGSAIRIFNRTFFGNSPVSLPYMGLNSIARSDLYIGLAEAMLNHSYFSYFISYITRDYSWYKEMFERLGSFINDKDKLIFDKRQYFECNIGDLALIERDNEYKCEVLEDPADFIEYCKNNMERLEAECYGYDRENFYLNEISQLYEMIGYYANRRLMGVYREGELVAFAVAEGYSEEISPDNIHDGCRIYMAKDNVDMQEVMHSAALGASVFFKRFKKEKFNILLNCLFNKTELEKITGIIYKGEIGRVMMNYDGMAEYKKILMLNYDFLTKYYPLTYPQKDIWYKEKIMPGTSIGNISGTVRMKGEIDYILLEKSINMVIDKNDGMRIRIVEEYDEPRQYISEYSYRNFDFIDFGNEGLKAKFEWDKRENRVPFSLIDSDLYYFALFRISETEGGFYIKMHHLISDAWTMVLMANQIMENYKKLRTGTETSDGNKPSYIDYILSEEEYGYSDNFEKNRKFWAEKFSSIPQFTSLKTAAMQPLNLEASRKTYIIPEDLTCKIKKYLEQTKFSVFMFMMSVIYVYFYRITSKEDIVIGTPVLNRANAKEKNMSGMFISAVPVRININGEESFESFVKHVSKELMLCFKNQKYPYELILKDYRENNNTRGLLNDIVFSYQNAKLEIGDFIENYDARWHFNGSQAESLVIHLNDRDDKNEYVVNIDYLVKDFSISDIDYLYSRLMKILDNVIKEPSRKINEIDVIAEEEKQKLLYDFNNTDNHFFEDEVLNGLFEAQVEKAPDNPAVVFEDKQLTYGELNRKANRLARLLREKGVKPNVIVGIMAERSLETVVGILAILKAGGAYLPIDPDSPPDRMEYVLKDSRTEFLLTESKTNTEIEFKGEVIALDLNMTYDFEDSNLERINTSEDLAYVIYTSGTTGRPKGVLVEHKGIVNAIKWRVGEYKLSNEDKVLQLFSPCFDGFITSFFTPAAAGSRIILLNREESKDPFIIKEKILLEGITHFIAVPSFYRTILECADKSELKSLKIVTLAGEKANSKVIELSKEKNPDLELVNEYGPTENSVVTTFCRNMGLGSESIIGRPINNVKVYILGEKGELKPVGIPGELCISGYGLARGYLNNPALTQVKFAANPFVKGERLYRTGDLARWLDDGTLEFLGRIDNQVKIRGFRVELEEIERQLSGHEYVRECAVVLKEDINSNKNLWAYISSEHDYDLRNLRSYLSSKLPDYMIPTHFVRLDKMPLNTNGKIDKSLLPEPMEETRDDSHYLAPRNEKERVIAEAIKEVFDRKTIGIGDNFFDLGGDSIKAIQVVSRLKRKQFDLSVQDIYKYPTVMELSRYINYSTKQIDQSIVEGEIGLTPIQKCFFEWELKDYNRYCQAVVLFSKVGFEQETVRTVFSKLVEHHDALRIVFNPEGDFAAQCNRGLDGEFFRLDAIDLDNKTDYPKEIMIEVERFQSFIDIQKGPLTQLVLFNTPEGGYLVILIHHLVIDGVSWRILVEDFAGLYSQIKNSQPVNLPAKTTSFKEWSENLYKYAGSNDLLKEAAYWNNIGISGVGSIPRDLMSEENTMADALSVHFSLSSRDTERLLKQTNRAYNTEINDILVAALGLAIKEWTGEDKALINMEGHGRESIIDDVDVSRTIGWFTSAFPFEISMENSQNISYYLKQVKESLRRIPKKGIGYGILRYIASDNGQSLLKSNIKPEINFNFLGQFEGEINNGLFTLMPFSDGLLRSPGSQREYIIDINGLVINNTLTVKLEYSKNQYKKETMQNFIESFRKHLIMIIDHCAGRKKSEKTPADFGDSKLSLVDLEEIMTAIEGEGEVQKVYGLSQMQEGMLFHWLADRNSKAYFEQLTFNLTGNLDLERLEKCFNTVIDRHDVLRTRILYKKLKSPRQVVLDNRPVKIFYKDLSGLSREEKDMFIRRFIENDREAGFDLTQDLLIRMSVFRTGDNEHKLILSFHHIIMDGWCLSLILKELFQGVRCFEDGAELKPDMPRQYSDYIEWLDKQDEESANIFWKEYISDYDTVVQIPGEKNHENDTGYQKEEFEFALDRHMTERLASIACDNQVTLSTVFHTLWGILIQKYNNTDDVAFGSVVSGRTADISEVEKIVGLFINTIPVRIKREKDTSFCELIKTIQQSLIMAQRHGYMSLADIQGHTEINKELINHIIVFENYPIDREILNLLKERNNPGLTISDVEVFEQTNYNLNVIVTPGEELSIKLNFNSKRYDAGYIKKIAVHFKEIVKRIANNPAILVKDIDIISEAEKDEIIFRFNNTEKSGWDGRTIHELFEEQVDNASEMTALIYKDEKITYKQLNERSNQLARRLREKGVKADSIVGIMADRSIEMIVGIYAILKAGGAYLPIDPEYPPERIRFIMSDSDVQILLTQKEYVNKLDFNRCIIELDKEEIYTGDSSNLERICCQNNLAYVLYTSGTTGNPKGVMIEHRGVVNLLLFMQKECPVSDSDSYLFKTTYTFDVSVTEIFGWFFQKGRLIILEKGTEKNPEGIIDTIERNNVTHINFVPSMFNVFVNNLCERGTVRRLNSLKYIMLAGEAVIPDSIRKFYGLTGSVKLLNLYGPTETTIYATLYPLDNLGDETSVPIGRPINNTKAYILDKDNNLQPMGAVGELCISGVGLARGYLNRTELTEEKFTENPFGKNEKIYKTGDLARWSQGGIIEFLGRIDDQVKIRGFRIELGEVQNKLLEYKKIKEAAVASKEHNRSKYLCAYIVENEEVSIKELRAHLLKFLPEYMVPSYFIKLDEIPLTGNGKLDRKALLKYENALKSGIDYMAPRNDLDEKLVKIFKEALGIENISINDNFFDLGGNSLSAMRAAACAYNYNLDLTIEDIYKYNTVREISDKINGVEKETIAYQDNISISIWNLPEENISYSFCSGKTDLKGILLTGASGFLGIHILDYLLNTTESVIYCLMRGKENISLYEKLINLLSFYFPGKYDDEIFKRLKIIHGDIAMEYFGLKESDYINLGHNVYDVFHAAGLVKHHGSYEEFEKANVIGTEEIVKFTVRFGCRLNYISTTSVSGDFILQNKRGMVFTEKDLYIGQSFSDSFYVKSKFEAEKVIFEKLKKDRDVNIYRVGYLTGRYSDGVFQTNISENKLYCCIKYIIELGFVPERILREFIEFTPVDFCAKAVVELSKLRENRLKVYHLQNHRLVKIEELFSIITKIFGIPFEIQKNITFDSFVRQFNNDDSKKEAVTFLINEFNFDKIFDDKYKVKIESNITRDYLRSLGFDWPPIDDIYVAKIIRHMKDVGFLNR